MAINKCQQLLIVDNLKAPPLPPAPLGPSGSGVRGLGAKGQSYWAAILGSSRGHHGVSCDTLAPLGAVSGGPCAQFAGLKAEAASNT